MVLPVVLVDPLWWVAARLRRILTGLMMLALALAPAAEARGAVGSPPAELPALRIASPAEAPPTLAAVPLTPSVATEPALSSSAPVGTASAARSDLTDLASDSDTRPDLGPAGPDLLLPELTATWAPSSSDERSKPTRRTAPFGQRAPPAR